MKLVNLIKSNKKAKFLVVFTIIILFIFIIGYSLAYFQKDNSKPVVNIKVKDLSFNMAINGGESNDRILHLKSGETELYNVSIINLNKAQIKYELIYDVCSDSNCLNILDSLPDTVKVEYLNDNDNTDNLNGILENQNDKKVINVLTRNGSNSDYYIRLNLNAGYGWNDLSLKNQIHEYNSSVDIIAYVDGVKVDNYPSSCDYEVSAKAYRNNVEINVDNLSITCDKNTKIWNTSYSGYIDKLVINFKYVEVKATTFAADSWETIAKIIQKGKSSSYPVGSLKEVNIGGTNYTVRVANNTTPAECYNSNFSETACGFVVEFVGIIEKRIMAGDSVGGWPASTMRTYANGDFYNKLPSELKSYIIDTKVISSYSSQNSGVFTSNDKIYLLSGHEVYTDGNVVNNKISKEDNAYNNTRQLDYYASKGVTTDSYSAAIKAYNGTNSLWWLRTASTSGYNYYVRIADTGAWYFQGAWLEYGFSPAFRIG